MKQGLAEILKEVSSKETRNERVEELKKHSNNNALRIILIYALNPHVKWLLPNGRPPFKPMDKNEDLQGILLGRVRKLGMFIEKGGYDHLPSTKREQLFIQLLESIDPDDAELLIAAKEKKLPYKGITKTVIEKAWPGFTNTWAEEKK